MLNSVEQVLFALAMLASLYYSCVTFGYMLKIVMRGQGSVSFDHPPQRIIDGLGPPLTRATPMSWSSGMDGVVSPAIMLN
jgi:hypothetical protein